MGFYCILMGFNGIYDGYPLVNCCITMENHHAINGKTHYFDWAIFNSKLLNYQRVINPC
jgi:hypothetical protein